MSGADQASQWRNERIVIETTGDEILLRSIQCRRCVHWPSSDRRRAKAVCTLHQRRVHMFFRCVDFEMISFEAFVEMILERMVADGELVKFTEGGTVKFRLAKPEPD